MLSNLIENAVKYSPDGGTVSVALAPEDRHVRFSISDSGLGIPPSEQRRIFEKFFRLDPDMTRGIGGTGLGLYICRELVRRVDGRIWVESDGRTGSTFHVEIPQETTARPQTAAAARPPPRSVAVAAISDAAMRARLRALGEAGKQLAFVDRRRAASPPSGEGLHAGLLSYGERGRWARSRLA